MKLENSFTIDAPVEKAWAALNNPETVAPCFPGATLTSYEDDSFTGTVKVKLGPISMTYKGKGTFVERDKSAHKVVVDAQGRDSRGNGTASAKVTASLAADGPEKTAVTMVTDMTITGKPAQFGRGVISDVADKIIGQFASCVADKLSGDESAEAAGTTETAEATESPAQVSGEGSVAPTAPASSANGSSAAPTTTAAPAATPVATSPAMSPMRSEIDAIDLLDTAGAPVLKRVAPILGGGLLLLLIVIVIRAARARSAQ